MAGYRKLGRTSSQRKALLRNQVTDLLYYGRIVTTEAKAKEVRKIAEKIIALGIKECNNYDTVKVTAKVARKDKDGKRVKEVVDGKKVTVYDEVEKEIKKDQPSRLHARRQMEKTLYTCRIQRNFVVQFDMQHTIRKLPVMYNANIFNINTITGKKRSKCCNASDLIY